MGFGPSGDSWCGTDFWSSRQLALILFRAAACQNGSYQRHFSLVSSLLSPSNCWNDMKWHKMKWILLLKLMTALPASSCSTIDLWSAAGERPSRPGLLTKNPTFCGPKRRALCCSLGTVQTRGTKFERLIYRSFVNWFRFNYYYLKQIILNHTHFCRIENNMLFSRATSILISCLITALISGHLCLSRNGAPRI